MNTTFKSLVVALACCLGAWSGAFAETSLEELASGFFFEGTKITLPSGTYTVLGDAIATVADNVDDLHFLGTGTLKVLKDDYKGLRMILR